MCVQGTGCGTVTTRILVAGVALLVLAVVVFSNVDSTLIARQAVQYYVVPIPSGTEAIQRTLDQAGRESWVLVALEEARASRRRLAPRPPRCEDGNVALTNSGTSSISSAPTKRSTKRRRRPDTNPREEPCRPDCPASSYPAHFETRLMSRNGGFRWASKRVPLSHLLEGQYIGLEEVGDGIWDVYYSTVRLGQMDERLLRVEDAFGRSMRNPQV